MAKPPTKKKPMPPGLRPGRESAVAHIGTARQCTANSKMTGQRCRQPTVKKGTVCRYHGGRMQEKAIRRREAEQAIRHVLGLPIEVDPAQALLHAVWEAAGNVRTLRMLVQELETYPGSDWEEQRFEFIASLYGPDHTGDGAMHILVKMYNEERDRLAKYSKMALDVGIAERQVRVAEQQGEMLVRVIEALIGDERLGLSSKKQVLAKQIAAEQLRTIDVEVSSG